MAIAESWHVRSRGRECAATQRPFTAGETIVTALFLDPDSSGYLRRDYGVDGWAEHLETGEKPFSFWRTTYEPPGSNPSEKPEEKLSAEEILQRLVEEDEDHTENARFILAVMLERQKLMRETDSQRTPTGILRVYEHRKTGEVFIVRDPDIPLSQIEAVQKEVFELLENNGRNPSHQSDVEVTPPAAGEPSARSEIAPDVPESEPSADGETDSLSDPTKDTPSESPSEPER